MLLRLLLVCLRLLFLLVLLFARAAEANLQLPPSFQVNVRALFLENIKSLDILKVYEVIGRKKTEIGNSVGF